MTDVALDPYSNYGHDGIIDNGSIINDSTIEVLSKMSLSHISAGADFVAPSDMMDGRVLSIRNILEQEGHVNAGIMSYSAKYASSFYGPFRNALNSAPASKKNIPKNKSTYQMDYGNRTEALKEVAMDIDEGADIIMIKPGLPYLDIIRDIKSKFEIPVAAYQVSGEYSMIMAGCEKGWLNYNETILETNIAFKRAGANIIASYFAKDLVKIIS